MGLERFCIRRSLWILFFAVTIAGASAGCMGGHGLVRRDGVELGVPALPASISWLSPSASDDADMLARWRESVGPPVIRSRTAPPSRSADDITIVSWNTALGAADVVRFVEGLRHRDGPLVLMLQEAYRGGTDVPARLTPTASFARRLGGAAEASQGRDVAAIAAALDLTLYYVPSMRNGAPSASDEDRGNAILSNLPLTDLLAIELPFERQRRVAIAATVSGETGTGESWQVRVVSAHLDNTAGIKRAWIAAEYARTRQARGLRDALPTDAPLVLAGDFNTWFGFSDQAYLETSRAFPATRVSDRRPTFHGLLRLDHIFFRLPASWHAEFHRADDRFGSDHYPLVGTVRFR
jgi:endonuclease/exonuclease/phosphatase family metal-dependent hydrolase